MTLPHGTDSLAERALLTVWSGLHSWHEDLVLVGGLVPRYHCKEPPAGWLRPTTLDADLGIALGASRGQYGSLQLELAEKGFRPRNVDGRPRLTAEVGGVLVPLDFLVEVPGVVGGSVLVDGVSVSVFPGVARALQSAVEVAVAGEDLYGARQSVTLRVCGIGAYLVLKLRAFAIRQHQKDAFDFLYTFLHCRQGPSHACQSFREELRSGNTAASDAVECLLKLFPDRHAPGPVKAAHFLLGPVSIHDTEDRRHFRESIAEAAVSAARQLLWGSPHQLLRFRAESCDPVAALFSREGGVEADVAAKAVPRREQHARRDRHADGPRAFVQREGIHAPRQ